MTGNIKQASDDLPALVVGEWVKEKHHYLGLYLHMVAKGMRKKWKGLTYIDLFAGPGKNIIRGTTKEIDGSPFIAAKLEYPFSRYIFVEKSPDLLKALQQRCQKSPRLNTMEFIEGDCNKKIADVISKIPGRSLGIALVDPYRIGDFSFRSLKTLVSERQIDLLINFDMGMTVKRNVGKFIKQDWSCLDKFLGDNKWRAGYEECKPGNKCAITGFFLDYYQQKLNSLGYKFGGRGSKPYIPIKNRNNVLMYYLFFASKHEVGLKLWEKTMKYDASGQRRMPL